MRRVVQRKPWWTPATPPRVADTQSRDYHAKVSPDDARYKSTVSEPVMAAVDALPREWRALINDYDYVDVYRAYLHRAPKGKWTPALVRLHAVDGRFEFR